MEKRIAELMEQKIQAFHQCIDAFELRVLARPVPTINLTPHQDVVASLRADVDNIVEMRGTKSKNEAFELAEDIVFVELFTTPTEQFPDPYSHSKRHHSSCTYEREDACAMKKERTDLMSARKASLFDEETHQIRAREIAARASSPRQEDGKRITTNGAEIVVGTTKCGPTTNFEGFKKPDPHTC